jgi:hypothetical protein
VEFHFATERLSSDTGGVAQSMNGVGDIQTAMDFDMTTRALPLSSSAIVRPWSLSAFMVSA